MNKRAIIPGLLLTIMLAFGTISCSDILNVEPEDVLTENEFYRDTKDADAAIRGLYGKMLELAPQFVVLNELRADLMDVTDNSDHFLRELANHTAISKGNAWANPRNFYLLINDCNNVIKNFDIMLKDLRIKNEEYQPRYADVVALRSWLYMQLVIHYGSVPYITKPVERIEDLKLVGSTQFPYLGIETMVDSLLNTMEGLTYKGLYTNASLITTLNGFNTRVMYIDKEYFLGELNLWKGNYLQAATYFRKIISRENGGYSGYNNFDQYKIAFADVTTTSSSGSKYNSRYVRYLGSDLESSLNHWPLMFKEYATTAYYNEWIWVMYYHKTYQPSPFVQLFALTGGKYLLGPSQLAMYNWDNQIQANGFNGDFRGNVPDKAGNTGSYRLEAGKPVITKFIQEYDPINNPIDKNGKWFLWRAGSLHLRFCEAANRDGQYRVAYALMNNGIGANFPGWQNPQNPDKPGIEPNDYTFRTRTNLPYPYNFDARNTDGAKIPPLFRGEFHRNNGLRNRVSLRNTPLVSTPDSMLVMEQQILDECALELAYEGARWGDLVRLSLRNNDNSILADRIARKRAAMGDVRDEALFNKLMDRNNWFLPLE